MQSECNFELALSPGRFDMPQYYPLPDVSSLPVVIVLVSPTVYQLCESSCSGYSFFGTQDAREVSKNKHYGGRQLCTV